MSSDLLLREWKLPSNWRWTTLSEIAVVNPRRRCSIPYAPDTSVTFIPMASVSEHSGTISSPEVKPLSEVSKGYTYFEEGDVLFAKITPCLQNGKHAIAHNLANGFGLGTTEFHVLRPKEKVTADWIHKFLRQPRVLREATRYFRGAVGQQRVPKEFLINLRIPLPPLSEQKRIVAILNKQIASAEEAKAAAEERMEAARALHQAFSKTVFESTEALTWTEKAIGDICSISAKQVDPELEEYRDLPHVNGENIETGTGRILYLKSSAELGMRSGKYLFKKGDVLYSKLRPYLRKTAAVNFAGLCSADMYPLTPKAGEITPDFLCLILLSPEFTQYANDESKRTRMPKLNRDQLMAWKHRIPPVEKQRSIIHQLSKQKQFTDDVEKICKATASEVKALPNLLISRALSGEI